MNYTIILKYGEGLLVWIYNNIRNKLTSIYSKTMGRFSLFAKYPLLRYSLIPVLIALFAGLRYVIRFVVNELAAWSSSFIGKTSGLNISEKTIVISIAAVFILLRVGLRFRNQEKKISNEN
jgi:hypothetical protein